MAGHVEYSRKRPERGEILPLFRHDDPDIGAVVPRPAAIVAEHGVDAEPGTLELSRHLRHRQGAERQVEAMLARPDAAPLHVFLLERRQPALRVLPDRFDESELGAAGLAAQLDAVAVLAPFGPVSYTHL